MACEIPSGLNSELILVVYGRCPPSQLSWVYVIRRSFEETESSPESTDHELSHEMGIRATFCADDQMTSTSR